MLQATDYNAHALTLFEGCIEEFFAATFTRPRNNI